MVGNITSLTNNGLRDWLVQRVTAVILAFYVFFFVGYFFTHPSITFGMWEELFTSFCMRVFTLLALLSLYLHAWIGIWTVTTDYLSCAALRIVTQVAVITALVGFFVWGIIILWGI